MRKRPLTLVTAVLTALLVLTVLPTAAWASTTQRIYRLYNQWNGDHLFTRDSGERTDLMGRGWSDEGTAWEAPASGASVWRLYNPWSGEHLYTTDKAEYDGLASRGWSREGVSLHSGGKAPVYRLYNRWLTAGTHLYTTDKAEYDRLAKIGWSGEGVKLYAEGSSDAISRAEAEVAAAQKALSAAQQEFDNSGVDKDALAKGSLGFFQHDNDAEAVAVLTDANLTGTFSSTGKSFISYTRLGQEGDATSLSNMKKALELIPKGNALRTSDNNFPGLRPFNVSGQMMAVSQVNANWSASTKTYDHAINHGEKWVSASKGGSWSQGEIIAWGGSNPYDGWYTEEKKFYDDAKRTGGKPAGNTGHYLHLVDSYVSTGVGYNAESGQYTGGTYAQNSNTSKGVDWQTYYDTFMSYYRKVYPESAQKAKAKLDQAQSDLDAAKKRLQDLRDAAK